MSHPFHRPPRRAPHGRRTPPQAGRGPKRDGAETAGEPRQGILDPHPRNGTPLPSKDHR